MSDTKSPNLKDKNYQKAKQLWADLVRINSQHYAHMRVMHCLPKHKQKLHNLILSQIIARRITALSAWDKASEKLNPMQLTLMRAEIFV